MKTPFRQRGVALITVLMVFFFASAIAAAMVSRQHLDIRRTANLSEYTQAAQYAAGVEAFAIQLLRDDFRDAPEVDHGGETWAQENTVFEVDNGAVEFSIRDLQGRFNINSLAEDSKGVAEKRFQLLLNRLGIDPAISEIVRDWLDEDSDKAGFGGAEDNEYLLMEPPYRAANRTINDISELRLLQGMTAENYQRLAPYLSALPPGTPINVNSAESIVLQSLAQELGQVEADQVLFFRENQPFSSVDENFVTQEFVPAAVNKEGLSVNSEYFAIQVNARFGDRTARLESIVHRDAEGRVRVLGRNLGRRFDRAASDANGERG